MKLVLIGAALVAAHLAAPAAANPDGKHREIRVEVADLDLSSPEGISELDRRMARAVLKACGTAYYLEAEQLRDLDRCRSAALERATAARDALIAGQAHGKALAARRLK
jgi:UrcA family protein